LTKGFNDETDSMTGLQTLLQWLLTFGNAYAHIDQNLQGDMQWILIHPSRVKPHRSAQGQLEYIVQSASEVDQTTGKLKESTYSFNDMLHLKGPGNGVVGYSIGEIAAQSMGITIAAQNYQANFFGQNLNVGSVLEMPGKVGPDVKKAIRGEWDGLFGVNGGKSKTSLAILDGGIKYQQLQMASTDAQLLESRKFQVQEIARWFRIPPHKIMDMAQAKFSNVEQNDLNYITDTLTPWISRVEKQLKFKFHRNDDIYIDLDEKGLVRGDMAARTAYYQARFNMGSITPNQIKDAEGEQKDDNPALDKYYLQLGFGSIDQALESQQLDNEAKRMADTEGTELGVDDGTQQKIKFDNLKSKFDAYGVAVRAGALTPQTADEQSFRVEAGLPTMSQAVNEAWTDDGGVRRPITLQSKVERDASIEEEFGIDAQASVSAYFPTMVSTLQHLVKNEYNAHNMTTSTDRVKAKAKANPQILKEHLDKFYIRHEEYLTETIKTHIDFLCTLTNKEKPEAKELAIQACAMSKDVEGWQDTRPEEIASLILESVIGQKEALQFGEVVKGDDGKMYQFTSTGFVEAYVVPKN
jgi:HK97 family phage portal protein